MNSEKRKGIGILGGLFWIWIMYKLGAIVMALIAEAAK